MVSRPDTDMRNTVFGEISRQTPGLEYKNSLGSPKSIFLFLISSQRSLLNTSPPSTFKMHFSTVAAGALALAPQMASAHFLFPHLMLNGVRTGANEYVREHDFGFMPHNNDWIDSPDFRCNVGSWNHRRQPKTAQVTAGKDTVGFNLHLDFDLYHPGPVTVRLLTLHPPTTTVS